MTKALSKTPAKTKVYRVGFYGPKGGYHYLPFTFKLNQVIAMEQDLTSPRGKAITEKMKKDGWLLREVKWYNSGTRTSMYGEPNAHLLYRIHRNDVYNGKAVKPGWKIAGEY